MHEYILEKMENQREMALKTISKVFPFYTNEIVTMLAHCYFEEMDSAEKIASECDLGLLDFLAIIEDEKSYRAEFIRDLDIQLQGEAYERSIRYA
jgi:hypothetical protein